MFAQVDTSLERSRDGLGIGLTLVKTLVEMHGGTVEAHSDGLGRGSEFIVRLPVAAETTEPPSRKPVAAPAATAGLRILIVDDNEDGAESLAMLLQARRLRNAQGLRRPRGHRSRRASASRCRAARHRPAEVERLRSVSPHPGTAVGERHAARGAHRLGHGGRPQSIQGGRFQRPPGQARGLRRPHTGACLSARPNRRPGGQLTAVVAYRNPAAHPIPVLPPSHGRVSGIDWDRRRGSSALDHWVRVSLSTVRSSAIAASAISTDGASGAAATTAPSSKSPSMTRCGPSVTPWIGSTPNCASSAAHERVRRKR